MGEGHLVEHKAACEGTLVTRQRMLRYILVFSILFMLGVAACLAASAADAPAVGQVAFGVSLGLFVAALAGGVTTGRRTQRHK